MSLSSEIHPNHDNERCNHVPCIKNAVTACHVILGMNEFAGSQCQEFNYHMTSACYCTVTNCMPVCRCVLFLSYLQAVRRTLSCVVLLGVLLVVLQPPLPLRGGSACPHLPLALCPRLWDERHIPLHSSEDAEVGRIAIHGRLLLLVLLFLSFVLQLE